MFRTLCLLVTSSFLSRVSCGPRLRLASRCGESKTLWDLMSRCAMPRAWRKAKAVAEGSRMFRCLGENTGGRWLVFWAAMLQQPVDSTPHADQLNSPHTSCGLQSSAAIVVFRHRIKPYETHNMLVESYTLGSATNSAIKSSVSLAPHCNSALWPHYSVQSEDCREAPYIPKYRACATPCHSENLKTSLRY